MLENLRGKKIAIIGLGVNNQKLAEYFKQQGIVFDVIENWQTPGELVDKLDQYQIVFRTPGLPFNSQAIQQAQSRGVEISSQTKLFFQLCPAPIIGVTGTKGKGTTASLLANFLSATGKKIWLGGNIGRDPFEFLDQIKPEDFVILELSSFQLQDLKQSPHVAVVLNVTSDHLNHHESVDEYVKAKSAILAFQTESDIAILHPSLPSWFKQLGRGRKIFFTPTEASGLETNLLGQHNRENIAAAVVAAKQLGVKEAQIRKAVAEFEALPHRLKSLGQIHGITYIDDAFSTNIDPTIAAIEAIQSPLVLIVGGFDKGLDFKPLGEKITQAKNIKGLVVIGRVTDKILSAVKGFGGKILRDAKDMPEIVAQSQSIANPGDTILFSPGTASFDMFKNEQDRGEQFVNVINKLDEKDHSAKS